MKKSFILILLSVFLLSSCSFLFDDGTRSCTVYHYFENIDDDEYSLNPQLTQKIKGNLNEETTVEALSLEGFTPQDFEQITLVEKENYISIYYKRLVFTVTFNGNGGTVTKINDEGEEEKLEQVIITGKYGTPITEPEFTRTTFIWKGWDKEFSGTIPAQDMDFTGLWTAEITNRTNRYFIRPLQEFVDKNGITEERQLCWDYCGSFNSDNQLIIWIQKAAGNNYNQVFNFEPVEEKDNTYYIFTNYSDSDYYLIERSKSYSTSETKKGIPTSVTINGLGGVKGKSSASLQFELVPVTYSEKSNEEVYAIKVSGTDQYVTAGPSRYQYYSNPTYMVGYGMHESYLTFDSLKNDSNGNIDKTQLFYLDSVEQ